MTASIFGMEQGKEEVRRHAVMGACVYCTNVYCQGPLPHGVGCMRVGRYQFMQPHDMPSWKRLSGERPYPAHDEVRRD